MYRRLTVLLALIPLVLSAVESENDHVVLGLFQKVHIQPKTSNGNPVLVIRGASILRNATLADETDEEVVEDPHRIVGGRQVSITEVPWQAALIQDRQFACGGSVISSIWVLTAGHCIYGLGSSTFVVRAGSNNFRTGGQLRRVGLMVVHGLFDPNLYSNDISMVRVTRRFTFDTTVQPIRLATPYTGYPSSFFVTGWGTTSQSGFNPTRYLRGVSVNFVDQRTCARLYSDTIYPISRNKLCAGNLLIGGRDSCQGDSGGPMVSRGIQYGIVSFGIGCGQVRYPGVNTNVGAMNTWILTVANSFSRRSHPDEEGEHDIRRVVIEEETQEDSQGDTQEDTQENTENNDKF